MKYIDIKKSDIKCAIGNNVIIYPHIKKEVLHMLQEDPTRTGEIIAIGDKVKYPIKVGDIVHFKMRHPQDIVKIDGKKHLIIEDERLLAIQK